MTVKRKPDWLHPRTTEYKPNPYNTNFRLTPGEWGAVIVIIAIVVWLLT